MVQLYPFQQKGLDEVKDRNRVAFYWDMGTGKTFMGSEKMVQLGATINLLICQKSKISDWKEHFSTNYKDQKICPFDLTKKNEFDEFFRPMYGWFNRKVGIINYDLIFRRPELTKLLDFTLILDESSMIQNENAKRSKFILEKLRPANVILLSGTPTGGKYEKLYSQVKLLGWNISKTLYWNQFIEYVIDTKSCAFPLKIVTGYKNEDRLKAKLREHGATFLKTEEVIDLPEQVFQNISVDRPREYQRFMNPRKRIVTIGDTELVGDTLFKQILYARMICGAYNKNKVEAFRSLVQSTEDRLIVFYNFDLELEQIAKVCEDEGRPLSVVNGKTKDLSAYEGHEDSVTVIQYQAGSMGLNLQKSNRIIYFTPPLSSELFEQSKKRTHRIGQKSTCFYYMLVCPNTIETKIYDTLAMRKDYTDKLFEEVLEDGR